ncbi:MAG: hypothetical protein GXO36_01680 [Chloroflexi bacterium]|nr:hypothetical protein [Chloroflexota bacterium]
MAASLLGRLLRATLSEFVVGTRSTALGQGAQFGAMVQANIGAEADFVLYGLIADIRIPEDQLVRQLSLAPANPREVLADQHENRIVPVEIAVRTIGYKTPTGEIVYLLPPQPPLSLTAIRPVGPQALLAFVQAHPQPGYLRALVQATDIPLADLLTTHLRQVHQALPAETRDAWLHNAVRYLLQLLRDDYERLAQVLESLRFGGLFRE